LLRLKELCKKRREKLISKKEKKKKRFDLKIYNWGIKVHSRKKRRCVEGFFH